MDNTIARCVAVIGLGSKEGARAATLHQAGGDVTGFDPSEAARADSSGTATTANIEDLAGTPCAVLSLTSAKMVESTVPQLPAAPGTVAVPPAPGVLDEYTQTKAIWVRTRAAGAPFPSLSC